MSSVGEKLRQAREARQASIDDLASGTGVGAQFLEAMERDDYDALPGRAFGKLYIRAYAEFLQFDPAPLIEEYDRAQRALPESARRATRWKPETPPPGLIESDEAAESEPDVPPQPEPPTAQPIEVRVAKPIWPQRTLTYVAAGALVITLLAWAGLRGVARHDALRAAAAPPPLAVPQSAPAPSPVPSPLPSAPPSPSPSLPRAPSPAPSRTPKPASAAASPSETLLTIDQSGIGGRIAGSELADERASFTTGQPAYFWTRVRGGRAGQAIKHVWSVNGRVEQSITLRLGGADYRTYSTKTLYRTGSWTVEARDEAGRVLATGSFTCEERKR
jgi:cytoskeleton protein RodZ